MRQETRSRRVVIAEDNDDMRAVIRELIESLGAEVAEAASGGDLIMLLTDEKPVDLLITDVRMPWMTGFQVSLAARNAGLTMPIIVVTRSATSTCAPRWSGWVRPACFPSPFVPRSFCRSHGRFCHPDGQ